MIEFSRSIGLVSSAICRPAGDCITQGNTGNLLDLEYDFHIGNGTAGSGTDNGNVWTITNYKDANRTQTFTYDALNRLSSAQNAGTNCALMTANGKTEYWGNSYTYDAWGNLTNKNQTKCGGELWNAAPALNNNQLPGYTYDVAGNMTNDGSHGYTFDAENRVTKVDSTAATYTYNPLGNRVRKDAGSASTEYFYFGSEIVAELNPATGQFTNYTYFNGQRVARRDPSGSVFYYFTDLVHSSSVVSDSSGAIKSESDFYPWGGELQIINNDPGNHYKFTGKERDSESQLDYFGARYYGNALGRFVTPDWDGKPVTVPYAEFGDPQSLNLYSYVRNSPVARVDADGHMAVMFTSTGTGVGYVGGYGVNDGSGGLADGSSIPDPITDTTEYSVVTPEEQQTDPQSGQQQNTQQSQQQQTQNQSKQEPGSLRVESQKDVTRGDPRANYGIFIEIEYQVLDKSGNPIQSDKMQPVENGTFGDGTKYSNPIVSNKPGENHTRPNGRFTDTPVGHLQFRPMRKPVTIQQNITIVMEGKEYTVRSQTYTVTSDGYGHGNITNGGDINVNRP